MLQHFAQATEEAIRSLRGAAELRFKEVIEEPSKQVSEEFESVMQSLEEKRRANLDRAAMLREQIGVVQSQLDSIGRYSATAARGHASRNASFLASSRDSSRAGAEVELVRLKQAVRTAWRLREGGGAGSTAAAATEKITFLSRCLRHAVFSPRLYAALLGHARTLRANADRSSANTRAVDAARAAYRATAQRMAEAAAQLR